MDVPLVSIYGTTKIRDKDSATISVDVHDWYVLITEHIESLMAKQ
jgi:hypothetical protein